MNISGDRSNIKMRSHRYRNSYYEDNTMSRPSYFWSRDTYASKDGLYGDTVTWLYKCNVVRLRYFTVNYNTILHTRRICIAPHKCIWPFSKRLWTLNRVSWWRHQMKTFSAWLSLCAGNSPVNDGFPSQRTATRSFDVFFDLWLIKRLSKQSRRRWFETPSSLSWRHYSARLQGTRYQNSHITGSGKTSKVYMLI